MSFRFSVPGWRVAAIGLAVSACVVSCGARSSLRIGGSGGSPPGTTSSTGGSGGSVSCNEGESEPCGSNIGACKQGTRTCVDGVFGPCEGAVGPTPEVCNGIDDDCNGVVDDGFHIGEPCKGTGTDQCLDGMMTCNGCVKSGPDKVEICNGIDDNCNGIIDADCEVGDCKPSLLVTGSVPSSPSCIDFPVMAGSTGSIEYPCEGGTVTAVLGGISFMGTVSNGFVSLDGQAVLGPPQTPDGCTWQFSHHIEGTLASGMVNYSYAEMVIAHPPGVTCWSPCTETGTVKITWAAAP